MSDRGKQAIFDVIRRISSERELVPLLNLLAQEIKELLRADLVSVFLFDREECELCSFISLDNQKICFDARLGIAGAAALKGETINAANAYEHPLFYKEIDSQTGYRTKTVLAVPIKNIHEEVIGVCEGINKLAGVFTADDAELLETFAAQAANAIETAQLIDNFRQQYARTPKSEGQRRRESGQSYLQEIVGLDPKIQTIVRLIDQIRDSSVDVLIEGESGTGKELVARALHHNSPCAAGPFVALNCAALPDNLVESELFGIEKGIATGVDRRIGKFEAANGGTLFLDEIGDLSLSAQAKVLRVLQERAIDRIGGQKPISLDFRVIAATNKKLGTAIDERTFREDLYYRLKIIHLQTPPLRQIVGDILLLANHFLAKHCALAHIPLKEFAPDALERLQRYSWPGNARQLENEVKRLVASVRGKTITADQLNLPAALAKETHQEAVSSYEGKTIDEVVEAIERRMIQDALKKYRGNKQRAAQALGLSRQGLIKKLKRLEITA